MGIKFLKNSPAPVNFILLYLLILAGVIVSSSFIYNNLKSTVELDEKNLFVFVSNLKLQQVNTWRDERISDAKNVVSNDFIESALINYLNNSNNQELKKKLSGWLSTLTADRNYQSAFILNNKLNLILSTGLGSNTPDNFILSLSRKTLLDSKILLSDFREDAMTGNPCLYMLVPLKYSKSESGIIIFKINPYIVLYPLLQTWPIPTRTAETIMVESKNDSVLALSPLRRIKHAEMIFKLPISQKDLPAARFLRGDSGLIYGKDYMGSEVVSYGQKVPSTPWLIITKINTSELFENIKEQAYLVFSLALLFIIIVTLVFLYILKKQKKYYKLLLYRTVKDKRILEKHNEYLIKHANDVMFLISESGNVIFCNERALQVYGYAQEEILKLSIKDLRDEGSWESIDGEMKKADSTGGVVFESLHKKKDGTIFPVEVSSRVIEINDKRYFQSIVRDISDRKEAERKIYELNRTYSFLSDVNQMIVKISDEKKLFEETCKIAINRGGFKFAWIGLKNKLTGRLEVAAKAGVYDNVLELDSIDFTSSKSKDLPSVRCLKTGSSIIVNSIGNEENLKNYREAAAQNNFSSAAVFPLKSNNKTIGVLSFYSDEKDFFTEAEIKLLNEMSGDVSYAIKYLKNEKKRKKADKALLKSWERYKELFENNPNPMWMYDDKTLRFIDVNKTAVKHYGYTKEEFLSMTVKDIRPKEEVSRVLDFMESAKDDIRTSFNVKHSKKDGTVIFVEVKSALISLGTTLKYRIVSINDITEQKRMMEEVIIAKEKAEEANKARNIFLGTMSHELRTPLIGILGYSDLLIDDLKTQEFIDMVQGIKRGGRRLLNTLNLILDFTRIESDRLEVVLKKMDIVEPLTYAFSEFEGAAKEKNLEYSLSVLDEELLGFIDEHLFMIIIENLINNAVKFTKKGSIKLIAGINEHNNIFIRISDTGIGIDEKHIKIIFQEFRQVSEGINREYQGTGLGLTITEKYIKMHNGNIEVSSQVNKGTTFTIIIPRANN